MKHSLHISLVPQGFDIRTFDEWNNRFQISRTQNQNGRGLKKKSRFFCSEHIVWC